VFFRQFLYAGIFAAHTPSHSAAHFCRWLHRYICPPTRVPALSASAPPAVLTDNDETRKLLEQTLSSAEIEREIVRIAGRSSLARESEVATLDPAVGRTNKRRLQISKNAQALVVRSYYMGETRRIACSLSVRQKHQQSTRSIMTTMRLLWGSDRDTLSQYETAIQGFESQQLRPHSAALQELATLRSSAPGAAEACACFE
jgi:hypothetical protein